MHMGALVKRRDREEDQLHNGVAREWDLLRDGVVIKAFASQSIDLGFIS